jgi:hypothetical protein
MDEAAGRPERPAAAVDGGEASLVAEREEEPATK